MFIVPHLNAVCINADFKTTSKDTLNDLHYNYCTVYEINIIQLILFQFTFATILIKKTDYILASTLTAYCSSIYPFSTSFA
jgi:hypothetical protein